MQIDEHKLKKMIADDALGGVVFIYGNESYLKEHYVKRIVEKVVSGGTEDFNFQRFDAKTKIDDLSDAVLQLPVFAEKRVVVAENGGFFSPGRKDESEKLAEIGRAHV